MIKNLYPPEGIVKNSLNSEAKFGVASADELRNIGDLDSRNSSFNSQVAKRPLLDLLELTSHLEREGYPLKALSDFKKCGEPSKNFIMSSCGCGTRAINLHINCNKSFCPVCSVKRQMRFRRRLLPFLKHYKNDYQHKWLFLTISPPNSDDYEQGKKDIRKWWSKFIRREYIKERIKGGFCCVEVTNKNDSWHFHIHAIIYSRRLDNVFRGFCSCGQSYLKRDRETKKFYCANRKCNKLYEGEVQQSRVAREFMACSGLNSGYVDISQAHSQKTVLNYLLKYVTLQKDSFLIAGTEETDYSKFAYHLTKSYHDRQINAFGEFYDFSKKILKHSFLQLKKFAPVCPCCGEIIKFSFDLEVNNAFTIPPPIADFCNPYKLDYYIENG